MTGTERPRIVSRDPFPRSRAIVTHALRAGRRMAVVHGILQIDVTAAKRALDATEPPGSMTAFVVSAVARTAARHPSVHAYRDWRGKVVTHSYVDVATMVEVQRPDGPVPMAHLIRDADVRDLADISAELRGAKARPSGTQSGRLLATTVPWVSRIPGLMGAFYRVIAKSVRARRMSGTVSVTSIGMFGRGGGIGIAIPTIHTLNVLVGGISERPVVVAGSVEVRDIMDLTISVNHDLVDGAPAARFTADLQRLLESPGELM